MATKYFVNGGGGAWNNTLSWSLSSGGGGGAGVPTASDDVILNANSPACTVSTTAGVCLSFTATNYTSLLTANVNITVSGNLTFGSAMTFAGTGTIIVNATATLTSNGVTVGLPLTLISGVSTTWTLGDNFTMNKLFQTQGSTGGLTYTINGNILTLLAGASFNGGSGSSATITNGTTNIVIAGTGTYTIGNGSLRNNVTINAPGQILTFPTWVYNTGTLTYTAGTINGTPTWTFNGSVTLDTSSTTIYDMPVLVNISAATVVLTLLSDFRTSRGLTLAAGGNLTINNFSFYISGGVFTPNSSVSGTATIILGGVNGASTVTWSGSSSVRTNITINTPGTVTISGTILYSTGTFTYTAGVVNTVGSTINIGAATTFNTVGMSFNNITLTAAITLTLNSTLSVSGTLTWGALSQTFTGTAGFNVGSLVVSAVNGNSVTLLSGVEYIVNNNFSIASTSTNRWTLKSSNSGVQTIFTLKPAASQLSSFVTTTDINSSNGQTIWCWNISQTNTTNWYSLVPSAMQNSAIYIT